jgi:hypothetical protein
MVEKATALMNAKQKQIQAQVEVLEVALASCDSSIEFTEQAFKNGNDAQILSMEKYILQSLEQLKTVRDQTKPCVSEDVVFIIPSSVEETRKKLLNEYDVDVVVAKPGNCQATFNSEEIMFFAGYIYSITLICNDENNRRLRRGGECDDIKPSFTGVEVSDVAVTDNKDGSYAIRFCPRQGGMLKFEVSINGVPAPNCTLTKQVKWVISEVHGNGAVTDGGLTLTGEGYQGEYCWRVGGCYFESGVHTWEVQLSDPNGDSGYAEVGIIDHDEINADAAGSDKKWVLQHFTSGYEDYVSLTVDMEKRSLNVKVNSGVDDFEENYQFTARRISPFFACDSPDISFSLVE